MNFRDMHQQFRRFSRTPIFRWSVFILVIIIASGIVGWSWWTYQESPESYSVFTRDKDKAIVELTGKISFSDIEGGCFSFETDEGKIFELYGEKAKEIKNSTTINKRIKIQGKIRNDLASICMIGRDGFLEVKSYEIIEKIENSESCGPEPPVECGPDTYLLCVDGEWGCRETEDSDVLNKTLLQSSQ